MFRVRGPLRWKFKQEGAACRTSRQSLPLVLVSRGLQAVFWNSGRSGDNSTDIHLVGAYCKPDAGRTAENKTSFPPEAPVLASVDHWKEESALVTARLRRGCHFKQEGGGAQGRPPQELAGEGRDLQTRTLLGSQGCLALQYPRGSGGDLCSPGPPRLHLQSCTVNASCNDTGDKG